MIVFTEDCDRDLKRKEPAASMALPAGAGKEKEAGSSERRVPLARLFPMESTAEARPAGGGKKRKASTAEARPAGAGKKRKASTAEAGKKRKASTADASESGDGALKEEKKEGDSLFKEEGDSLFKEGEMLKLWQEYWEALLLWEEALARWLERKKTTQVPAVAGKKKKKVVRVSVPDDYIEHIIKNPTRMRELSEDEMAECPKAFRQSYAIIKVLNAKKHAYQQALIDQYRAFGYAYSEKEVTDDDEKVTDDDEKEVTDKEVAVVKN